MKKSEYQKFQDFKKRHNLSDQQIVRIISDYANTADEYAASFFAAKYNISNHVFYKIRDYTIIFMLVDATVCVFEINFSETRAVKTSLEIILQQITTISFLLRNARNILKVSLMKKLF